MRVREMTLQDVDAVRSMLTEFAKGEEAAGSPTRAGDRTLSYWMRVVGAIYERSLRGCVLIAEEGETPIGLAAFYMQDVEVDHVWTRAARSFVTYVREAHRRKGVARELIAFRDELAKSAGCDAMLTTTRLGNAAMRSLLVGSGYTPGDVTFEKRLM